MTVTKARKQNNDKGFSLVELIIVVSILAIAAIPLIRSMGMATRVNAKAQSMQNATSLAESIMEEIKSTPIDTLKSKYGTDFSGGVMTITRSGVTATQGEKFIATITIDTNKYSDDSDTTTEAGKVIAANVLKLPTIEEVDTMSQAVLSSLKELNKYDTAAQSFFDEKNGDDPSADPAHPHPLAATITSKTIDITKENAIGVNAGRGVTVRASVTYEDNASHKYVRDLYTGSFIAEEKDDGSGSYKDLDSNIYIFYQKSTSIPTGVTEVINIYDGSYPTIDTNSPTDSHRIYFIDQNLGSGVIPVINCYRLDSHGSVISSGTFKSDNVADLTDGIGSYGGSELVTNYGSSKTSTDGHIYREEARIRIYDITVVLTKSGDTTEYAKLTSTVSASDATPTPTPTP